MRPRLLVVTAGVVLAAAGAGCGEDTPSEPAAPAPPSTVAADRPYVEAVAAAVEQARLPLDDDQRACFAGRLVEAVGADSFEQQGVRPPDLEAEGLDALPPLTADQVTAVANSFTTCRIDLYEYLTGSLGSAAPREATGCLKDAIGEGTLARILALSFGGTDMSEETQQPLVDAYVACGHLIRPPETPDEATEEP